MDFQRRFSLAIVLCVAIWLAAQLITRWTTPESEQNNVSQTDSTEVLDKEEVKPSDSTKSEQPEPEKTPASQPLVDAKPLTHRLESDVLALQVTNVGGIIQKTELLSPQFRQNGQGLDFLNLDREPALLIGFNDELTDFKVSRNTAWEVVSVDDERSQWNLRYQDASVEILAFLTLSDGYAGQLTVKIVNHSDKRQEHQLVIQNRFGRPEEESQYNVHRGLCAQPEDIEDVDFDDVSERPTSVRDQIQWVGLDSKYFLSAVIPSQPGQLCEIRASDDSTAMLASLRMPSVILEANESRTYDFGLYLGTKELERLENYSVVSGVELERAIDWGWFGGLNRFLGRQMLRLLRWFYELTGVWGVAILLLTVVVKLITLPLTLKQMASMKHMKEIQPELAKLREKYANDRLKLNQEMQALFARSGVNPLAGCLPLLVQMPIWFALYAMLGTAVELYREPFLWLPDLTQRDPYFILPLAMGAVMFLQSRLQPTPMDSQQAKMMMWLMPIIFTVMMLFLPSGLGIYIFANVVLSLIQTLIQVRPKQKVST